MLLLAINALSMFSFYILMPVLICRSSATLINLTLLTADLYSLFIGLYLFNYTVSHRLFSTFPYSYRNTSGSLGERETVYMIIIIGVFQLLSYNHLRNRKHFPCFHIVIETRVKVWENEKWGGFFRVFHTVLVKT